MAAPQIPNLNTLRGPRSSEPGRGGERGRGGEKSAWRTDAPDPTGNVAAKDKTVQQTDQDASVSRMSAIDVGYLKDAFAEHFAGERHRRFPIINRG